MASFKRGNKYWYKFYWKGTLIRRSTRQSNNRIAQQMESAHRAALAKGEVGINPRPKPLTVKEFAEQFFEPHIRATFAEGASTLSFYLRGQKCLLSCKAVANARIDEVHAKVADYVSMRQKFPITVRTINCELETLRRMLRLAVEWGLMDRAVTIRMLPGENQRERVLSAEEEKRYFSAASPLLKKVATILIDCGLRPDECFRLRRENITDGAIQIFRGKTAASRRRIPMTQRVAAIIDLQTNRAMGEWIFPAPTRSGHIEKSSLRKQHLKACKEAKTERFPLYTFRHTCLTRWAAHMDAYTLGYLAGHTDMQTTKRYVHPQDETVRQAMGRVEAGRQSKDQCEAQVAAGTGHNSGHSA